MGSLTVAKPIAVRAEVRVKERGQNLRDRLLNDPVQDRRDTPSKLHYAPNSIGDGLR